MHFKIFLLFTICAAVSGYFIDPVDFLDEDEPKRSLPKYNGCFKLEDTICAKYTADDCSRKTHLPFQCPRMCGGCAPFTPKCPKEYPFGCCWNGEEATDVKKSNCPKCEDISPACKNKAIKEDCDYSYNTAMTREGCPVTCGACRDYGFEP
ncbi:uncharacterized protein LOC114523859 [Dendronephthya gigantea]|uniref:uncharacterized protein LOC114523859 n=1 Tax=Dendronephthya gigantea TaxID=151771 RepID=UPI00106A5D9C|nr:uncharacterized protein LOC114523859 [Dendronephthya gigantea]XP_028400703.1 uncharacterized protein LOC114523859 [Dendronephthya gigantea]